MQNNRAYNRRFNILLVAFMVFFMLLGITQYTGLIHAAASNTLTVKAYEIGYPEESAAFSGMKIMLAKEEDDGSVSLVKASGSAGSYTYDENGVSEFDMTGSAQVVIKALPAAKYTIRFKNVPNGYALDAAGVRSLPVDTTAGNTLNRFFRDLTFVPASSSMDMSHEFNHAELTFKNSITGYRKYVHSDAAVNKIPAYRKPTSLSVTYNGTMTAGTTISADDIDAVVTYDNGDQENVSTLSIDPSIVPGVSGETMTVNVTYTEHGIEVTDSFQSVIE